MASSCPKRGPSCIELVLLLLPLLAVLAGDVCCITHGWSLLQLLPEKARS
jgi:hypothetical protein